MEFLIEFDLHVPQETPDSEIRQRYSTEAACLGRVDSRGSTRSTSRASSWAMLSQRIIPELESGDEPELQHDSTPNAVIRRYRQMR